MSTLIKILVTVYFTTVGISPSVADDPIIELQKQNCISLPSCASCLTKSYCTWCVNKGKCTRHSCGSDNHIHAKNVAGLMSGPEFCPRIVESEKPLLFKSGQKVNFVLKLTQIHIYMAFTPWKCRIQVNGREEVINAFLLADEVYCDTFEIVSVTDQPYTHGNVAVLWDFNKAFDGIQPFKVCRCDLIPTCGACP